MAMILDGIRCELAQPDLDGDGKTGGTEKVRRDTGITHITQPTELGETIQSLNDDSTDYETRMSKIDMNTRLGWSEIPSCLAIDSLVAFKLLPTSSLALTRQKKRLNVSLNGQGRKEIVEIVGGKREQDAKAGGGGFFSGLKERLTGS